MANNVTFHTLAKQTWTTVSTFYKSNKHCNVSLDIHGGIMVYCTCHIYLSNPPDAICIGKWGILLSLDTTCSYDLAIDSCQLLGLLYS